MDVTYSMSFVRAVVHVVLQSDLVRYDDVPIYSNTDDPLDHIFTRHPMTAVTCSQRVNKRARATRKLALRAPVAGS